MYRCGRLGLMLCVVVTTACHDGRGVLSDGRPVTTDGSADTLVPRPTIVSIEVTPTDPTIGTGWTQAFTATATLMDLTTMDVTTRATWTSSDHGIATISSMGLATGVGDCGRATITAEVCGLFATTELTAACVDPMEITTFPSTHTLSPGATVQLMAAITSWTDGSTPVQDITGVASWSSSDPSVATVQGGQVMGVSTGSATITASLGAMYDTSSITVTSATLERISVLPLTQSIAKGEKVAFTAEGSYSDKSKHDVSSLVDWKSSPPGVLTFDRSLATGRSMGTATVIASHGGVTSNPATVQVGPALLTGIEIAPERGQHLALGDTIVFTAAGTYSDGMKQDLSSTVIWSASPAGVLTFTGNKASASAVGSTVVGATLAHFISNTTPVYVTLHGFGCGP